MVNRLVSVGDDFTLPASVKAGDANLPERLGATELNAAFVAPITQLELVPVTSYGTSWVSGGFGVLNGTRHMDRVASRLRSLSYTNRGTSGAKMVGIADTAIGTYTPGTSGLVLAEGTINDQADMWYGDTGASTTAQALRAFLAFVTAGAAHDATSTRFAYKGTGWAAGATSTAGDSVDVAFTGDSAFLLTRFVSGTGATITATNTGTGAQLAQVNTGGYKEELPGVIKVSGLGAGAHTVRFTLTSGTGFSPRSLLVPNPKPPTVVWFKEGPISASGSDTFAGWNRPARLAAYHAAQDPILAEFPSVVVATVGAEWLANPAAMMSSDGLHPNAKGHGHIADRIIDALRNIPWRDGQNLLGDVFVDTSALPAYTVGSVTAPAAPAGFTAVPVGTGIKLNWLTTSNGGAPITDYVAQYSTDGTTWSTFAHTASTANTATITGLTNGATYSVRVALVNSAGTGAYSSKANILAGIAGGFTSVDDFNRPDNATTMGMTSAGSFNWATGAGTFGISGNKAYPVSIPGEAYAYIDDGLTDFTQSAKFDAFAGDATGLMFRYTNNSNFLMVWVSGGVYKLLKKSGGAYSTVATSVGAAAAGDVVEITAIGSAITVKVNGTSRITATDAFNQTATMKGFWAASTASRWDDWSTKAA